MDWPNEKSLRLIGLYEKFPVIWDHNHDNYYSHKIRNDAWKKIADELGCSTLVARNKMQSLLASFRREKTKAIALNRRIHSSKGRLKVYNSRWFAFKKFQFLLDKKNPNLKVTHESEYSSDNVNQDGGIINNNANLKEEINFLPEILISSIRSENEGFTTKIMENYMEMPSLSKEYPSDVIVKEEPESNLPRLQNGCEFLEREPTPLNKSFKTIEENINSSQSYDNCDVFALYVANKLKKYNEKVRSIVEHKITNVLFQADMSAFDDFSFSLQNQSDIYSLNS